MEPKENLIADAVLRIVKTHLPANGDRYVESEILWGKLWHQVRAVTADIYATWRMKAARAAAQEIAGELNVNRIAEIISKHFLPLVEAAENMASIFNETTVRSGYIEEFTARRAALRKALQETK